jgi:hypothetical protein
MRIYIAGPMTGHPNNNYPAFHAAADKLRAKGHDVKNPAENSPPVPETWENWMKLALAQMVTCDAVCLLPDWHTSRGAKIEYRLACDLGMDAFALHAWLEAKEKTCGGSDEIPW